MRLHLSLKTEQDVKSGIPWVGHFGQLYGLIRKRGSSKIRERVAEWLRRLTRKAMVRTAVGSNPALDSLVAVRNSSPGRPEPCVGNLVTAAGSCGG